LRGGELIENAEEFVLAKVAAVTGVGTVRGVVHFVGFDELVADGNCWRKAMSWSRS